MRKANLKHGQRVMRVALRHPIAMVALPAALLLVCHLGGERGLVIAVVLLTAALGGFRFRRGGTRHEDPCVLPGAEAFDVCLEKRLCAEPRARTGCVLIRPNRAEVLARELGKDRYDRLLRLLAAQLRPALREDDAIARIDRNTLAVALFSGARLTLESIIQTALRLQRRLDMPIEFDAGLVQVGTRIGFGLSRENDTAMSLVGRTRAALEEAGPGAMRCASENAPACDQLAIDLACDLPNAFAEGQIKAFYQPQFCTETDVLSGVEALARWQHPRYGLLGPGQFLQTVVAANMIGALTEPSYRTRSGRSAIGTGPDWWCLGLR